ncbi:hypothetical protein CO116_00090 [Candidatus Falkowbacteria bacterium CG_4_9_14_3_um_filter_38_19]|uniref:Bacterial sugar transferase domain-containing protein n=1 Tax=Candidatus Falkowbacteria bacterium CG_4_9_14_3_um_filter_38_19 TaxID=1974559 RepID=A0A2M8AL18_9BACT|nr:MAG: hypothetical protein CO116_00090 [Candidatus Falkowbacteria bacterium CG_4_9_14_3_um_filter_38_19]
MLKRLFDVFFSFLGLIFFSPLLILLTTLIKLDSPGSVFFRQERVGKNGRIFKIYKFRTMEKDAEKKGVHFTTPSTDPRITKIGRFLRKFYIDEIPQLINVLKGEMSLVGPRAEVPEIVTLYNEEQKKVLSVKPGMVDYASLEFRKEGEIMSSAENLYQTYTQKIMPEKLKLSLKYINEKSLWLDFKLIIKTLFRIISDII